MLEVSLRDIIAFIVTLGSCIAAVKLIMKPWIDKGKRIERLERVVFDENGNERYVTRFTYQDQNRAIIERLDSLIESVNTIGYSQAVLLDVQIEMCDRDDLRERLMAEKNKLDKKRTFV